MRILNLKGKGTPYHLLQNKGPKRKSLLSSDQNGGRHCNIEPDLLINLTRLKMTDVHIKQWSRKICSMFKLVVNKTLKFT